MRSIRAWLKAYRALSGEFDPVRHQKMRRAQETGVDFTPVSQLQE
jgi:hypothetical protein